MSHLTMLDAVAYFFLIPSPSSRYVKILIPCSHQFLTRAFWIFVKTKGADTRPNGRTEKTKHYICPCFVQLKPRNFWWDGNMSSTVWMSSYLNLGIRKYLLTYRRSRINLFLLPFLTTPRVLITWTSVCLCHTACRKQFHDLLQDRSFLESRLDKLFKLDT